MREIVWVSTCYSLTDSVLSTPFIYPSTSTFSTLLKMKSSFTRRRNTLIVLIWRIASLGVVISILKVFWKSNTRNCLTYLFPYVPLTSALTRSWCRRYRCVAIKTIWRYNRLKGKTCVCSHMNVVKFIVSVL